ncbi:MAG TPA: hypothetical protein VN137_01655 [Sphingomonas sp.]|nr:hypothetical protein [Sphingomonas sp.]
MHALAIGHAGPDAAAAVNGLWNAGYHSIMRVEESNEAAAAIASFHPELIFVLPDVAQSDSMATLRDIAKKADAPVIVARSGTERALDCLGPTTSPDGADRSSPRPTLHFPLAA